jgi:hypothetical protein
MADNGERPAVSRPLVRILADMVEAALKRDGEGQGESVQSPAIVRRRNDSERGRRSP